MTEVTQKKFQVFVRKLARQIRDKAEERLPAPKSGGKAKKHANGTTWVSAYIDARWFSDAEGFTSKLRVVLPDGTLFSTQTTHEMSTFLHKISSVRKEDSSTDWYGLKVIVTPDGKITHELNNDPNCVVDPTWYYS